MRLHGKLGRSPRTSFTYLEVPRVPDPVPVSVHTNSVCIENLKNNRFNLSNKRRQTGWTAVILRSHQETAQRGRHRSLAIKKGDWDWDLDLDRERERDWDWEPIEIFWQRAGRRWSSREVSQVPSEYFSSVFPRLTAGRDLKVYQIPRPRPSQRWELVGLHSIDGLITVIMWAWFNLNLLHIRRSRFVFIFLTYFPVSLCGALKNQNHLFFGARKRDALSGIFSGSTSSVCFRLYHWS